MNISVIGAGYVGLVTGACLASQGFDINCFDIDAEKIKNLKKGILPIYEPDLVELISNCMNGSGRLQFTNDPAEAIGYSNVIFITVNTPTREDNSCNLEYIMQAAEAVAEHMDSYRLVVDKSTVPVGTGHKVKSLIANKLKERHIDIPFDVVSNPEFLREGSAIHDFLNPDRIVIGADTSLAIKIMKEVYSFQLNAGIPCVETDIVTAEMIKYAANSFLAAKISFINEIANICELCGADVATVTKGIGLDKRIGEKFLSPGPGFGGSCFPKDVRALSAIAASLGYESKFINCILEVNKAQKARLFQKIEAAIGNLENSIVTILGLSFKPETDDIRESPSISIIERLLEKKATIKVYDPRAMENMKRQYPEYMLQYCADAYDACRGSDCIVLMTPWPELSCLDFKKLATLVRKHIFIDSRNTYSPAYPKSCSFHYEGVGRI